ncbi:unnamed protein product [Ixodes hexagonus]
MYKLMTGRVPFRGKTRQVLKERIISAPLKWPRLEEHAHSATTTAKDMAYRMLKKNPVERLGSRSYADLKTHPFFDQFNWKMLYTKTELCDIPSIAELLKSNADRDRRGNPEDRRLHQQIEEMTDINIEAQKPLLCYASPSFKKLMASIKQRKYGAKETEAMMESSVSATSSIDYDAPSPATSSRTALINSSEFKESPTMGTEKVDLILFRKKKFYKYWSYGFHMRRVMGQESNYVIFVDSVAQDSPADRSQVLPLDVILAVSGVPINDATVGEVKKLIAGTGDQMVLSVMASSSYRMLTTRRDMMTLMHNLQKETVVVCKGALSCLGSRPYGLGILDASVWNEKEKQFSTIFVLTHADVTSVNDKPLFPGDVITHAGGTSLGSLNRDQVMQLLSSGARNITLTVIPLSPLRTRRIFVSKLHETAMSDTQIPSKSTAANIESE